MYYVYYLRYYKSGIVKKGYKTFDTRSAQMRYIREASLFTIAITAYN